MGSTNFPPCPPQLKSIQHYLKLGADYEQREAAISYWARLYALQSALKIDKKSPEAKALLTSLMDHLEKFKKEHANNEGVTSDIAAQAMIENEAHKLFTNADNADRQGHFDKNVVKAFYTAGILMDVCEVFGALNEELTAQRKYAKWKATYIHNCLKNGETPISGPIGESGDGTVYRGDSDESNNTVGFSEFNLPAVPSNIKTDQPQQPFCDQPQNVVMPSAISHDFNTPVEPSPSGVQLTPAQCSTAQKYCKYAVSSIDYEDFPTAVGYLQKALYLLTTGRES